MIDSSTYGKLRIELAARIATDLILTQGLQTETVVTQAAYDIAEGLIEELTNIENEKHPQ